MGTERFGRRGRVRGEAGVSTVEVVILTPVFFAFVMAMVVLGIYAQDAAEVQDAAQDAARMGSLQRSSSAAYADAYDVAKDDMGSTCNGSGGLPTVSQPTTTVEGDQVELLTETVTCQVSVFGMSYTIQKSSSAPVDFYRGGQP
jgi:Flp pilus assembly protein TadG